MTKRQSLSGYLEQIKSALNKQDWAHAKRLSKISAKKLSSFHYTPFEEYMLYRLSGLVYYHLAEYSRSIDVFYKAYLIALKHHFEPIDIAFTSLLIGNNFLEMRNISQALNQLQKVEQYYQKPGNKSLLSDKMYPATYIGLAWCYLQKNDLEKVREIIDAKLSLPNLFQSNKLARIDYYHLKGEYQVVLKEYNMATQSFQECVKLSKELNFQQGLITGRINLAIINLLEKRLDLAIPALNNIFDDARRLKLNELICESGLLLSKCYSLKNMSHKAEMIEKRIKLIINKLDSVWLYEKTREFEKLFRQIQSATKESTLSPAILADTLNQHIKTSNYKHIVGKSVPMQEVYQLIEKVAPTDLPILIQGETGTGKELIANAIHTNSLRADKIYFPFNCGVLPETLIESSLFGHTKGSFTGAVEDKKGYIELASDGTLFIDEVANMSPSMQQKLLRVMEEKLLWRLGASKPIPIDTRFIFASNQDIEQMVKQKQFREDLFYRINTIVINLPPLRERKNDIPLLAQHFLRKCSLSRKEIPERSEVPTNVGADISPSALALFTAYPWPGNIRELQNEIKRICALYPDAKTITEIMLSEIIRNYLSSTPSTTMGQDGLSLKEIERNAIITALQKYQGNITQTARQLGLTRFGLRKKLKHDSIKPADVTKR